MAEKIASIIIPALNEAESIGYVLSAIPMEWTHEILVVDGGSTDATVAIAEQAGARVIHEGRRGYGRACHSGLLAASGKVVVFLDADGADDPRHLPELLAPLMNGQADLVLGSRLAGDMDRRRDALDAVARQFSGRVDVSLDLSFALNRPESISSRSGVTRSSIWIYRR